MEQIELRVPLSEDVIRDLLWCALTPDALVMQSNLNAAIDDVAAQRDVVLDAYRLTGISVLMENGTVCAEMTYTPTQR